METNIHANYLLINQKSWNNRVEAHVNSDFYDMEGFMNGNSSLNNIELELLGNVKGKKILHLQCHFGQDSLSLSRMGANVTGVDLSDKAIEKAKEITSKLNLNANFICCDLYDLPNHLNETFDIVFTSYGTIGWLPDLDKWANVISHFLKPGGTFVFAEFHPVVWMFDANFKTINYRYFNSGAIIESENGTYADKNAPITQDYVMWNHSISEVVNSLIKNELIIQALNEFDYSPYNCFNETIECGTKCYRIKHLDDKIPMVYALLASKIKV
jgi:2-polyprenyl-3-methyl-5-hydroxy-6-metoxy-1,4-benzoquinol methylase